MRSSRLPRGRKAGCLPRKSKPGEWCPLASEKIEIVPREDWEKFKDTNVKPFIKQVLNQGSNGSCATESTTQATMICRAEQGLPFVLLNPLFIYNTTSGGRDNGSSIDENLQFAREHGIAPESVWPRSKGFKARPSDEAVKEALKYRIEEFYDIQTIEEFVSCLLKGFPVVWGANGHSVCKVVHLNDKEGVDVNSWGTDWGTDGFGVWAPYRQINWQYGAWAVRSVVR